MAIRSCEEYQQIERELLENDRGRWRRLVVDKLAANLLGLGFPIETSFDAATKYIDGEIQGFSLNADTDNPELFQEIEELYRLNRSVESFQFMFMYAPVHTTEVQERGKKRRQLTIDEDRKKREQEIESFCLKAFPAEYLDSNRLEEVRVVHEVNSENDIEQAVSLFFGAHDGVSARKAIHAVIVFLGHGSKKGFHFANNFAANLDKINEFIGDCMNSNPEAKYPELPARVLIIYAQCHGHLFDDSIRWDRFQVYSVATKVNPVTCSYMSPYGEFYIEKLNEFGEQKLKPEIQTYNQSRETINADEIMVSDVEEQTT